MNIRVVERSNSLPNDIFVNGQTESICRRQIAL